MIHLPNKWGNLSVPKQGYCAVFNSRGTYIYNVKHQVFSTFNFKDTHVTGFVDLETSDTCEILDA